MHYVRMSTTVMAMQSCHCDAKKNHPAGEEFYKALPRPFYESLRINQRWIGEFSLFDDYDIPNVRAI